MHNLSMAQHRRQYELGEMVHSEQSDGIEYQLWISPDDLAVRGNALASGDDAEDKACEDEILARLESGDVWAWAAVTCRAIPVGNDEFWGADHLGGCSYENTAGFLAGGYWADMKEVAKADLLGTLERAGETLDALKEAN